MARAANRIKISNWPGDPLPEPCKLTAEQNESVIAWFTTLPLKELRYRQRLCEAQMTACAKHSNPYARTEGHENQFRVWRQLAAAVGRQQCK